MAAMQFKNNFSEGINLDLSELRIHPNAAVFIKNLTNNININQATPGGSGQNEFVITPLEGNAALPLTGMPSGTNYQCGFYSSEQTNEGYFAVWNSGGNHTVWVISGDNGQVRKVHENTLLPFVLDPAYFLAEGRMTLELISKIDPATGNESNYKLLVFTNNNKQQCLIDVEASIATDSYTTTYFTDSAAFYDRLELIHLGSVLPIKAIGINTPTAYTPVPEDANKQNQIINAGWQIRIRTWDVWGRPSEWGIISSVYTALTGGGCIATSNGLPRCFNACFDAGSPLIKFITVAYRRGVGNDPSGQTETNWYETETFSKYDDTIGVQWYERPLNPVFTTAGSGITFDASTNIITYTFCADKGANPVDPEEAARTEPGLAVSSASVASINESLLTANNLYDFDPIPQSVIDNVVFSVKPPSPSQTPCPAAPPRTIIAYAHLYNAFDDKHPLIRKTFGVYTFGDGGSGVGPGDTSCYVSNFKVGQVFGDQDNPGFMACLAGTPFKTRGVWGDYDPVTDTFTPQPIDPVGSFANIPMIQFKWVDVPSGKYIARMVSHHATLNDGNLQQTSTQVAGVCPIENAQIPWGCRVGYFSNPIKEIEVDCSTSDVNLGGKSSPMFVVLDLNDGVKSNGIDGYLYEEAGKGPVEMAVCYIHGSTLGSAGDAYGSFFTDHNGYYFCASNSQYCGIDILASLCDGTGMRGVFSQTAGCGGATGKMAHGYGGTARNPDYFGNFGIWSSQVYIARPGGIVATYPAGARRTIRQKFTVCSQPTLGIPGIPVAMTKCQPSTTDSSGLATLIAHNRYNYLASIGSSKPPFGSDVIPDYGSSPGNQDYLIFSQKGGCEWNACGGCATYMADALVIYLDCGAVASGCMGTFPLRTLCLTDLTAQPNGVGISGIQTGGKYPVAFWCHDVIGRHTSPQVRMGELGYVYVPNLNDTTPSPYPAMALCTLQVTIGVALNVSPELKRITLLVGGNCLFEDLFSWAADWVQYVDNTGVTNTTNPTAIRIYFQSLNEYNKLYNFKTNVGWDFLVKTTGQVLPSDIVQFIMNGDGTWLPSIKGAAVTYDQFGFFFTIDYQPELAGLQNGCLFRVIRPKQNTTGVDLPYYEQSLTLDISNGLLPAGTYDIPYQDSYLLSRSIPVPIMAGIISSGVFGTPATIPLSNKLIGAANGLAGIAVTLATAPPGSPNTYQIIGDQGGGVAPGAAPTYPLVYTNVNNSENSILSYGADPVNEANGVVVFTTKDYPETFPFFFESPSPSDLWGSHLASRGRVGIPNPYEMRFRIGTEIAISNPLADKGIVNGMGIFLELNRKTFPRNTFGDITVVLVEQGVCMVICNNDYFTTNYNSQNLQVVASGQVVAQNRDGSIFTAPQTKIGSCYGVVPANINTIEKYNGLVKFLDNKGHLIFSDFSSARPTEKDNYMGYLLQKIAFTNLKNLSSDANGLTYWHGRTDPKTMQYVLTNFNIPNSGSPSYINTDTMPTLARNETYVFDLMQDPETGKVGKMRCFASFTPEMYGRIPGYYLQRQFLSFKNGIPYIHHNNFSNNVTPPPYCNFYGVQCDVRVTHVVNGIDGKSLPDKVKRYLYTEVYCRAVIAGAPGEFSTALFYSDVITTEKGQQSRLLPARFIQRDGTWCAEFLCDLLTPADPNIPEQTGAHVLLDGNPLQGRWLKMSLTNQDTWTGTYFEFSENVNYINFVEKSAD